MRKSIVGASLIGLALSLSGCLAGPMDETADSETTAKLARPLNGGPWTWVNSSTLRCLDSNGNGDVYTGNCNNGSNQNWTNTELGFGDQIRNQATGRCLDSNSSGTVYSLPCNGGSYQQWAVTYTGTFGFEVRNVATGFCLDSDTSGNVYALACNGGNFQRWR